MIIQSMTKSERFGTKKLFGFFLLLFLVKLILSKIIASEKKYTIIASGQKYSDCNLYNYNL